MASAFSPVTAHAGLMNTTNQHDIQEFRAPSWAGDWCAKCEWEQTCTDCRACWI